jgi:hypothetical protein
MPLQNRVTPFGEVAALPGRGMLMGNRGVLHDDDRRIVRTWDVRRWIACVLEFRGRKREVMTPRRYTELFFLDEAAAFSAGHRPCAECRRADYVRFRDLWVARFGRPAGADDVDARIHGDRLDGKTKRTYRDNVESLPDGTYVALDGKAMLLWRSALYPWSDGGYGAPIALAVLGEVDVLTPRSLVEILAAGYRPGVHRSAGI